MKLLRPFEIRSLHFSFEAHDDVLNRTVTIFLLVRKQLERIAQVFTKSLRDRVRPKKLRFIFVCAQLHYQNRVGRSPFKFFSIDCTPPTAVFLRRRYPRPAEENCCNAGQ